MNKHLLILLILLSCNAQAQITFNRPSVTSMGTAWFKPITITMENDSIVTGFGYQDGLDRILFIKKKSEEVKVLSPKDWTTFYVANIKKITTSDLSGNNTEKYAIKLKGGMGNKTLIYKIYEKPSIKLYGDYPTADTSKRERSFYFIKLKGANRAEKLLIDFSEINERMPKRVFKKFGNCSEIKKEMKNGNYKKTYEDFNQLIETLNQHPGKYEFIDKLSYDELVSTQRSKIKDLMTVKEFYQLASPLVTGLGCLHTRIVSTDFFKTPPKYWLPLIVWFENEKMYATNNCVKSKEMNLGAEILEINDVPASEIYETLKKTISADAFNEKFYRGDLNVNFLYYYHSYYGFDDIYTIKFRPHNSKKQIETVFNINEPTPSYKKDIERTPRLNLEIHSEKSTAVIRIKNFNFFPRGRQNIEFFKETIDDYFDKIDKQKINKIAFDLRGNRGGNPECTKYLLSYISSKEVSFYKDNEINKSRNRPIIVEPKNSTIADKKVYFLVDGRCASATSQMLAVVKSNKLATIIGEEIGGTYSTFPGRGVKPLKNTKLALQLGSERESVDVPKLPLDEGIKPDINIFEKLEDIIKGKDLLLEYVMKAK